LKDVLHGVRDLVKQARSRFHAGACREAQDLAARLDKLRASTGEEGFRAGARLRAVEAVLAELEPLVERAQQITFIGYLNPTRIEVPSIPLVQTELPDLERAIRNAAEEAKKAFAERNGQRLKSPPIRSTSAEIIPEVASVHRLAAAAPAATLGMAAQPAQDLFRDMLAQDPAGPATQKLLAQSPSASLSSPSCEPSPARKASSPDEKPKPEALRKERLTVLEIDPSIPLTVDLVRRHFNLLAERYAAEKFASAGADFVALAQSKREAILQAATALLEAFGEKVEAAAPAAAEPQELRRNPDLDAVFGD